MKRDEDTKRKVEGLIRIVEGERSASVAAVTIAPLPCVVGVTQSS
jgi:hypothetical protein